jgi:hypothetical protein
MTSSESSLRRELVGHVFVDHGGVVVVDPMYAELSAGDQERIIEASAGAHLDCGEEDLDEISGHVGAFVATGLGDGRYPIYADVVRVRGAGERVARIVIDCLGVEPESGGLREQLGDVADSLLRDIGFGVKLPHQPGGVVDDEVRRRALGDSPEGER